MKAYWLVVTCEKDVTHKEYSINKIILTFIEIIIRLLLF